jgi:hypothetical protein
MKISLSRLNSFASVLLILSALVSQAASIGNGSQEEHLSALMAKITLPNGTAETVRLNGVGCTESICSRVLIKGKAANNAVVELPFDSIAAIRDIRDNGALFVLKDHSEQRLSFVSDFRVLYLAKEGTRKEKLDLAKIKSFEILGPAQ